MKFTIDVQNACNVEVGGEYSIVEAMVESGGILEIRPAMNSGSLELVEWDDTEWENVSSAQGIIAKRRTDLQLPASNEWTALGAFVAKVRAQGTFHFKVLLDYDSIRITSEACTGDEQGGAEIPSKMDVLVATTTTLTTSSTSLTHTTTTVSVTATETTSTLSSTMTATTTTVSVTVTGTTSTLSSTMTATVTTATETRTTTSTSTTLERPCGCFEVCCESQPVRGAYVPVNPNVCPSWWPEALEIGKHSALPTPSPTDPPLSIEPSHPETIDPKHPEPTAAPEGSSAGAGMIALSLTSVAMGLFALAATNCLVCVICICCVFRPKKNDREVALAGQTEPAE